VHVQPQSPLEHGLGDQQTVGRDDHRPHLGVEVVEPLGLAHLDPEPLRGLLRRRRRELPPAAARTVRPREEVLDVVLRGEPLEHVRSERRGRGDRQLHQCLFR
jgi:hypothetical protein